MTAAPPPELAGRQLGGFLLDARTHLGELDHCLAELADQPDAAVARRALHHVRLLGTAAEAVGAPEAVTVAAALEHALDRLATSGRRPGDLIDSLRLGFEVLRAGLDVTEHRQPPAGQVHEVVARIRADEPGPQAVPRPAPATTEEPATGSAPGGVADREPDPPPIDIREVVDPGPAPLPAHVAGPAGAERGHFLDPLVANAAALARQATRLDALARRMHAAARSVEGDRSAEAGQAGPVVSLHGEPVLPAGDELRQIAGALHDEAHRARVLADAAGDELTRLRLTPVSSIAEGLGVLGRDVAARAGRAVQVEVSGAALRIDVSLADLLSELVPELVGNAVRHGIEAPDERVAAGKPREGSVAVRFVVDGGVVRVQVADDGRGIGAAGLSASAAPTVAGGSRRGLARVRADVEARAGGLAIDSEEGAGTTVSITLPAALPGAGCVLLHDAGRWAALPITAVQHLVAIGDGDIIDTGHGLHVRVAGTTMAAVGLGDVLDAGAGGARHLAAVLGHPGGQLAVLAEGAEPRHEVVVAPLPAVLGAVDLIAAAAVRADGTVAPLLSVSGLARRAG